MPPTPSNSILLRRFNLLLLFLFALAIRALRALQQPVVNPDAIRFIDQAKSLSVSPLQALRSEVYHPLHSIAAWIVHALIASFFHNDRQAWLAAVQTVGVICGSIVAIQIVWLARDFGAPRWAAFAAAGAWIFGRRTSSYGADGLSDMLFLSLFAAAILTAIRAMRFRTPALTPEQTRRFALVGILAGFAYLTRPEGLSIPLIIASTLLLLSIARHSPHAPALKFLPRRPPSPKAVFAACTCMIAGTALPALPYMIAIGGLTHKKSFTSVAASATHAVGASFAPLAQLSPSLIEKISMELWETFGFAPTIALLGACLWTPRLWGRPRLRPLVVVWTLIWLAVMAFLISHEGYLDGRHTLPLQLVLHALLALAFIAWTKPMRWWMNWWRRKPAWDRLPTWMRWSRWPYAFAACAIFLVLLPGAIRLTEPPLESQTCVKEAADWVAAHTRPEVTVCDRERLVGYYANHPYHQWLGTPQVPALAQLPHDTPVLLTYMFRPGLGDMPTLAIGPFRAIAAFQSATAAHGDILLIYALPNSPVLNAAKGAPLTTLPATPSVILNSLTH